MLRIAVVTAHFPSSAEPTRGRPAYETLRVLSTQCDVQVFYPHSVYPKLLRPRRRTYDGLDPSFSLPGVKTAFYDYPVLPVVSRPFNGGTAGRVLLPHVRNFAPDLILSYCLYPDGFAGLKIAQALRVPFVAMGVGSEVHSIADRFSAAQTRTVLQEADFLLAISGDLGKRMIAMGAPPEKTQALLSGCDLQVFHARDRREARQKLNIDPSAEAVVYIGRMDLKKGLRELVEASAKVFSTHPKLQVYMVGDGPDASLIQSEIRAANANAYIHLLPGCAFSDVAVWMAAADLVTLPSYMEGCPNVVLEALACGRPVVASNVGGIPELMNDEAGKLVPARDAAALSDGLALVLSTTWDAAAISQRWSRSWDRVADELLEVLEKVMSTQRAKGIAHFNA